MESYMQKASILQRVSQVFLWLLPIEFPLFSISGSPLRGLLYQPGNLIPLFIFAAIHVVLMCGAVWTIVGEPLRNKSDEQRHLLVAAVFLLAAWTSIEILIPMGPPIQGQTYFDFPLDPYLRHTVLVVASLLAFGGFAILTAALLKVGVRVLSMLGFAGMIIFTVHHIAEQALAASGLARLLYTSSAITPDFQHGINNFLFVTSAFSLICGYMATGLYAVALPKLGLGNVKARVFAGISFFAVASLLVVGIASVVNNSRAFNPFGIPAIPFLLPYFMGVTLLQRAGHPDDGLQSITAA